MNWGRGLFRLWVVGALAWIAIWLVWEWPLIKGGLACTGLIERVPNWCAAPIVIPPGYKVVRSPWDIIFWSGLLLPPAALLALGLLMRWAFRGFRR